jgi:UPF0755 protein
MQIKKSILFPSIIAILLIFIFTFGISYWLNHPYPHRKQDIQYYVAEGSSFSRIAHDLSEQNIILGAKLFTIYGRFGGFSHQIKTGTYSFEVNDSPKIILDKLFQGKTISIKVTLAEGLNQYQYAEKMSEYFPKVATSQWLELMQSKELIDFLQLKEHIDNLEGFLYPETYFWDPNEKPKLLLKSLLLTFKANITPEMIQKAKSMGLSEVQFVTFASIVEKESALPLEREKIAGVYWNRLRRKMKLQADPSVAYGSWSSNHKSITKKDLDAKNKYNTYINEGLPIGPIANPGKTSFLAVLNPTKFDALYFVAKGDGTHVFSNNYKAHQQNVRKYLHFLKKQRKQK